MKGKRKVYICLLALAALLVLSACGDSGAGTETAGQAATRDYPTPDGRIVTANQAANNLSVIDVATERPTPL